MEAISINDFNMLRNNPHCRVLKYAADDKPKIMEIIDEDIIKVFYRKKKRFSRDYYYPKAKRFFDNAKRLNDLNISAPNVTKVQYCPELQLYLVRYKKCLGKECRQWIAENNPVVLSELFKFIASLHQKGIFFRAIHLANILYHPETGFSLIDIADVYFKNKPLGWTMRYRNLQHLFRSIKDRAYWQEIGINKILQIYLTQTSFSPIIKKIVWFLGVMRIKFKIGYFRTHKKLPDDNCLIRENATL